MIKGYKTALAPVQLNFFFSQQLDEGIENKISIKSS